jgi:YVTN family beta-propeller protein
MKSIGVVLLVMLAGAAPLKADVGEWTYGLAGGGGSVWAGGLSNGDVLRIDPTSGKVLARVDVGIRVFNLASAPGAVWAVSNLTDTVARVDVRTSKVTAKVRVGSQPYDVEWGFGSAWVSNAGAGTVSRITGTKVVKTIKTGVEPNGLTAYRGSLWVTDHTLGTLTRIDPRTNRSTGTVALPGADWVTGLGDDVYVSQETNVVSRVDMKTLKVTASVKVKRNPLGSAVVGGKLLVPCIDANAVVVVDPATMRVVETKPAGPGPIVVLPAGAHYWVSHTTGNTLWRF